MYLDDYTNIAERDAAAMDNIHVELQHARDAHSGICSMHQGIATIREEYLEAEAEVFVRKPGRATVRKELQHLAAMCVRMIVDLDLDITDLDGPIPGPETEGNTPTSWGE